MDVVHALLMCFVCTCFFKTVICSVSDGSDLQCIDPDTGDLHAVNSTWQSQTFCGNYTCKLRMINDNETSYKPSLANANTIESLDKKDEPKERDQDANIIFGNGNKVAVTIKKLNNTAVDKSDTYLTENEIKSITKFLHTVKKSDLEALVEVYNTAEDIYKEMETSASENIQVPSKYNGVRQTPIVTNQQQTLHLVPNFYHPTAYYNNIYQTAQSQLSNDAITAQTIINKQSIQPKPASPECDSKRYPYAYPILSYPGMMPVAQNPCSKKPSCLNTISNQSPVAYPQYPFKAFSGVYPGNQLQQNMGIYQPLQIKPHPFSYQYNVSYPYQNMPKFLNRQSLPNIKYPQISLANNQAHNLQSQSANQLLKKIEGNQSPAWKTEPLSANVIDDIRAKFEEKSKILLQPLPLKVKLEKIGKVLRLDQLVRSKRHIGSSSEPTAKYEAYVEKIECQEDNEPGYFKMGDSKQPFPACCPQRIV